MLNWSFLQAGMCDEISVVVAAALPKTADPAHMASNEKVDFVISETDMETLKAMEKIADYGQYSVFPVFSGKPLA